MPWLTVATTGGHSMELEVSQEEADACMALINSSMHEPSTPGCLLLRPRPGVEVRVRLGDVVVAEVAQERPPTSAV